MCHTFVIEAKFFNFQKHHFSTISVILCDDFIIKFYMCTFAAQNRGRGGEKKEADLKTGRIHKDLVRRTSQRQQDHPETPV